LLVVSPHLDDAALSCAALLDRGEPVDVLTVFAGAPKPPRRGFWDTRCGFDSSAESIPARRREEETALAGHRLTYLDLFEMQYVDGPRPQAEAEHLVAAVADWLETTEDGTVALPAGAGWRTRLPSRVADRLIDRRGPPPHPDHVFVRDALLGRLPRPAGILLYEELPYLWAGPADGSVRRTAERHKLAADLVSVEIDRERKARRLRAYPSQLAHLSPPERPLDSASVLPPVERYWTLSARGR
jgi:LmbE family N-acetylglucosaminyl deacetylase